MKNVHSKNLKRKFNIFQLISFCNCRIPNKQLYVCNILSLQQKIEPHVFVLSIPQFTWQDLTIACKSSKGEKGSIIPWNLINEQKQPMNKVLCEKRCSSK